MNAQSDMSGCMSSSHSSSAASWHSSDGPNAASCSRIEMVQKYFEEGGYRVEICGGNPFLFPQQVKCVEMRNGASFHVELSNLNDFGCDVDIVMTKLSQGLFQDIGGWRLAACQEKFAIHNPAYGQGKFVFYSSDPGKMEGDTNVKNEDNVESILEITFSPEAYNIFYKKRHGGSEGVKNIRLPKRSSANLKDVLEKLEKKKISEERKRLQREKAEEMKAMAGNAEELEKLKTKFKNEEEELIAKIKKEFTGCFFDGRKILSSDQPLQSIVGNQGKEKPLLLLRENEMVAVKLDDQAKQEIEIKPTCFNLEDLMKRVTEIYDGGEYQLNVGGEEVNESNWTKCLNPGGVIEVTKIQVASELKEGTSEEGGGYRGIGLTRGIDFDSYGGFGASRGTDFRGGDNDGDFLDFFEERAMPTKSQPAGVGVVRFEGPPVQGFNSVISDPNAPFITSPDDKVVMTIHLVTMSG